MQPARPMVRDLYDDTGPRDAAAIVLVHGATLDRLNWVPQAGLAAIWRLIVPDLPWHGRHRPGNAALTIDGAARFLLEVLDDARIKRAVFVGFSFGGLVAQRLAELAPDRIVALVLYACPLLQHFPGMFAPELAARIATADTYVRGWPAVRQAFAIKCADAPAARADVLRASSAVTVQDYRAIFSAMTHAVRDEPGFRLPMPSAYIFGDRDLRLTNVPAIADAYRRYEPEGEAIVIPSASHCAHWEAADDFNAALIGLLTRLGSPAPHP
jgi:3-oxoadipate enol-lactonase